MNPTVNSASTNRNEDPKTKIIIGCFVGITIFCALLLIVFYKVRRKTPSTHEWETKKAELGHPIIKNDLNQKKTQSTISGSKRSIPADLNDEVINRRSRPSESDKMSHPSGIQSDMYSQGDEGPHQNTRSSRHQKSSRPQTTECRSNDSRSEKSH